MKSKHEEHKKKVIKHKKHESSESKSMEKAFRLMDKFVKDWIEWPK